MRTWHTDVIILSFPRAVFLLLTPFVFVFHSIECKCISCIMHVWLPSWIDIEWRAMLTQTFSNWFYGPVATVKCNFLQTTDTSSQYVSKATYHIGICTKCVISHSWYMFITWYLCWEVVESKAPTKARYFDVRPSPVVLMATKKSYFLLENQVISILVKTNQVF